jgi:diguanylate cyclase (GGDEF)-like protein/PAS domain S-box-containing protein
MSQRDTVVPVAPPLDEGVRLSALRHLEWLDSPPTDSFDRLTRLAAGSVQVPIALITCVDERRLYFKSRFGLEVTEVPRAESFCSLAVERRSPIVVPDASRDPRFCASPLVVGAPHIRAYIGIPLLTRQGHAVGTLCAMDTQARDLAAGHLETLRDYAHIVEASIHSQEHGVEMKGLLNDTTEREIMFRDTFEQAAVGIMHADIVGNLQRINRRACQLLGYEPEELRDVSFADITHPDDLAVNAALFQQMRDGRCDSYRLEKRFMRKDGSYLWTEVSVALKRSASGQPAYMIGMLEDIAARKQAELERLRAQDQLKAEIEVKTLKLRLSNEALKLQVRAARNAELAARADERRMRAILNNVPACAGYWNRDLRCEFANEKYHEHFGLRPGEMIGTGMAELLGGKTFEKLEPFARRVLDGHPQRFERTHRAPDGTTARMEIQYIPDGRTGGEVHGFYVLALDVTATRAAHLALETRNLKLTNDSCTDYLTGLANRRVFSERSETAWKRYKKSGEVCALILIDLDNFKQINDVHGHGVGDEVLKAVGTLLKGQLRSQRDLAARLGGEEFAILCFGEMEEDLVVQIAERLRVRLGRESIDSGKQLVDFTASFGLAISDSQDLGWKDIYSRADAALYQAKAAGKNQVKFGASSVMTPKQRAKILRSKILRSVPTGP